MLNECDILARGLPLRASESGGGVIYCRDEPVCEVLESGGAGPPMGWVASPVGAATRREGRGVLRSTVWAAAVLGVEGA